MAWELQAGHLCWYVTGTMCEGRARDGWEEKMELCEECPVFLPMLAACEQGGEADDDPDSHLL